MKAIASPRPERALPHSTGSEQEVLAWAMLCPDWIPYMAVHHTVEDFWDLRHQAIFTALLALQAGTFSIPSLTEELEAAGKLDAAGGVAYIAELIDHASGEAAAEMHSERLQGYRRVRAVITAARRVDLESVARGKDGDEFVGWAETELFAALRDTDRGKASIVSAKDQCHETFVALESASQLGGVNGVPTPFYDLDRITGGWQKGKVIVLAARPSMGKTALAKACAWWAGKNHHETIFFTLEVKRDDILRGMVAAKARINTKSMMTGDLEADEWPRAIEALSCISESSLSFCEEQLSIDRIAGWCRVHAARKGLGLVVIDYLQLITAKRDASREREIANISAGIKGLARELDVPVLVLSQLNREVESRQNKRPIIRDLRDSGSIEQDADVVAFLYRDDFYHSNSDNPGVAEVHIAKNRNGPCGTIELRWTAEYTRFDNLSDRGEP